MEKVEPAQPSRRGRWAALAVVQERYSAHPAWRGKRLQAHPQGSALPFGRLLRKSRPLRAAVGRTPGKSVRYPGFQKNK